MVKRKGKIGERRIGDGEPVYVVAEIGINHNGALDVAKRLIDVAVRAGCDAVKFQKRTPELCVPRDQRNKMRETPWGYITYMDYRDKVEFGLDEYREIDAYCQEQGCAWFASCWDEKSVDLIERFDPPCHKIPSAALTDDALLRRLRQTGRPLVVSTGMSTIDEIRNAVDLLGCGNLVICHSTSTYPCPPDELNLRMITTLREVFACPVGYSGHEVGVPTTLAAVSLGACYIERHVTLDRTMWGADQAASLVPEDLERLVRNIRVVERALGDGVKQVYESEMTARNRLRRVM